MINSRHCFKTNTWKIVDQKLIFFLVSKKKKLLHFYNSEPKRGLLIPSGVWLTAREYPETDWDPEQNSSVLVFSPGRQSASV